MKMSWIEKGDCEKSYKIKTIDKKFADIPKGSRMLIASPPIIDEYVKSILYGEFIEPVKMRDDLAKEYNADLTRQMSGVRISQRPLLRNPRLLTGVFVFM